MLAVLAVATSCVAWAQALPSRLSLDDWLTLTPGAVGGSSATTQPSAEPAIKLLPIEPPQLIPNIHPPKLTDQPRNQGVQFADLKNEVMTLAYRNHRGLGLGAASTGGVAFTAGVVTEGGLRLNLYYVHGFPELTQSAARAAGIQLDEELPEHSVGLTIGWKF